MLEASKNQVPHKSYSPEIRIDSVNQILKNKEKVKKTRNISVLTRITDCKVPCVYIHLYLITKNWGPGLYNSLRHADNRRYFSGLSLMLNRRETHMLYLAREVMINEFKYGQTWKIWPSPHSLSLYNPFNKIGFNVFYVIMTGFPIITNFKWPIYQTFN